MGRSSAESRARARRRLTESEATAREGTAATEVASDLAEEPHAAEGMVTEELFQPPNLDNYINVETEDDADDVDPPLRRRKRFHPI